jgi:5-methyltetrahydrofolate--homocysteine methyltransferase
MDPTGIDFSAERWERVKSESRRWWRGELKRPLICLTCGRPAPSPAPPLAPKGFTAHYPAEVTPDQIVDVWTHGLSATTFVADAFPCVWPNFGPGVAAAFLGCTPHNRPESVWFHPAKPETIDSLRLAYDPDNRHLARVRDVMRAAARRWQGSVQVGMTDLGGTLDILSSFLPGEQLLLDLVDKPDAVLRQIWKIHDLWFAYFDELDRLHRHVNPGYTAWTPIFSEQPYYMFQCDFAYMISPEMFRTFVRPEFQACCRRVPHGFYHLDGIGQLPHLDDLLSIPELKGIQWVPGDGQPDITHWPEVYRRIRKAGKLVQIFSGQARAGWRALDAIAEQIGSAEGIVMIGGFNPSERAEVDALLRRHGAAE